MTTKYYFRPDSNGNKTYIEGDNSDSLWNPDTCIEVTKRPDYRYDYDFDTSEWCVNEDKWMSDLRARRNKELDRMDKFMTVDFPISDEDLVTAKTYRQDLRDCTSATEIEDRVLPDCPDCCKDEEY